MNTVRIEAIDLTRPAHAEALVAMLEHYAMDPMGGGHRLERYARENLVAQLRRTAGYHGALAVRGREPVGLINCFTGFSTFAARPLLNIHDVVVRGDLRGQGIGGALLRWAEDLAGRLGCCKLTLEVLTNNQRAMATYRRAGFAPYELDPAAGEAVLLQKIL
jgi:GNAT superfamily N-acetyltransferase